MLPVEGGEIPPELTLAARLHGARWLLEGACAAPPADQPQLAALAASLLLSYLRAVNERDLEGEHATKSGVDL